MGPCESDIVLMDETLREILAFDSDQLDYVFILTSKVKTAWLMTVWDADAVCV